MKIKKLVGLEIKDNTYNKFVYVGNHLEAFLKWKIKKTDYPLEELTQQFLDDFEYYLKTKKKQQQITINKTIQRLRTPKNKLLQKDIWTETHHLNKENSEKNVFLAV